MAGEAPDPATAAACSLAYTSWNNFDFWNGSRQPDNNCYCYAGNWAAGHFAMPGRKGGQGLLATAGNSQAYADKPSAADFRDAMKADGWKLTCDGTSLRVVGLYGKITHIDSGVEFWDFHFYRKNLNGSNQTRFCHKPGSTAATNQDASGNYITSVPSADRAFSKSGWRYNYNEIVDTFFSPSGTRKVEVT